MKANVKKVLRRVKRWPPEDQDELGRLALEIEARRRRAVSPQIAGEQVPGQQLLCQQLAGQQALDDHALNAQFLAGPVLRETSETRSSEETAYEQATADGVPVEIRRPNGPLVAETHGEAASDADVAATRSRYAIISAA